jgi:hypothetical protein
MRSAIEGDVAAAGGSGAAAVVELVVELAVGGVASGSSALPPAPELLAMDVVSSLSLASMLMSLASAEFASVDSAETCISEGLSDDIDFRSISDAKA